VHLEYSWRQISAKRKRRNARDVPEMKVGEKQKEATRTNPNLT
jgi:hypothetical protein